MEKKYKKEYKKEHSESVSQLIKNHNIIIKKLADKDVYTDDDLLLMEKIKVETKEILFQTEVFNRLSPEAISILNDTKFRLIDNNLLAFSYTPVDNQPILDSKTYAKVTDNNVIAKHKGVLNGKVVGTNKSTLGIIDDLTEYEGTPTLDIYKIMPDKTIGTLHDISIDNEYRIAFDFVLNRFPSKVHIDTKQYKYDSVPANIAKKYTTRRADLISFNYGPDDTQNTIQFGAIAPYNISVHGANTHDNTFDNFSIAACINHDTNKKFSIATDFKFGLGETYNVLIKIKLITQNKIDELSAEQEKFKIYVIDNLYAQTDTFVYDNVTYTVKSSIEQIDKWQKVLQESNLLYEANSIDYNVLKENYKIAIEERLDKCFGSNPVIVYKLEDAKIRLQFLEKYLESKDYFGNRGAYDISLFINGKREETVSTKNKIWGNKAKLQKMKGLLPTSPGFEPIRNIDKGVKEIAQYSNVICKFPIFVDNVIKTRLKRLSNLRRKSKLTGEEFAIEEIVDYRTWIYSNISVEDKLTLSNIEKLINGNSDIMSPYSAFETALRSYTDNFGKINNFDLQNMYGISNCYILMKQLDKLGVGSKIVVKNNEALDFDTKAYRYDTRIYSPDLEIMEPLYVNFGGNIDDVIRVSAYPATLPGAMTYKNAVDFSKECESKKGGKVVLKPRLQQNYRGKISYTRYSNKLPPHKVSVPVYTTLGISMPGIFPHQVVIEKPAIMNRADVSLSAQSNWDVVFNKIDLTKLYSICSTPYIIKK
jgi:hypothetical protein